MYDDIQALAHDKLLLSKCEWISKQDCEHSPFSSPFSGSLPSSIGLLNQDGRLNTTVVFLEKLFTLKRGMMHYNKHCQ
jgi:hypothetical protein